MTEPVGARVHDRARGKLRERALDQPTAFGEHDHVVAEPRDHVHLVLDQQNSDAVGDQRAQVLADLAGKRRVDAGHRLVEQQQSRLGHQRAADLEELLLPAGQLRRLIVEHARQVEPLRNRASTNLKLRLAVAHRGPAHERPRELLARLVAPVQQQMLEHGEPRKAACDLERPHQAAPRDAVGPFAGDIAPGKYDAAGIRWDETADAVEQRGLAGAVRSDQSGDPPVLDREVDARKRGDAVEAAGHGVDVEQSHDHLVALRSGSSRCEPSGPRCTTRRGGRPWGIWA